MKLPILTEAQILGVKHPIVKGIARFLHHGKPYTASLVAITHTDVDITYVYITPSPTCH